MIYQQPICMLPLFLNLPLSLKIIFSDKLPKWFFLLSYFELLKSPECTDCYHHTFYAIIRFVYLEYCKVVSITVTLHRLKWDCRDTIQNLTILTNALFCCKRKYDFKHHSYVWFSLLYLNCSTRHETKLANLLTIKKNHPRPIILKMTVVRKCNRNSQDLND